MPTNGSCKAHWSVSETRTRDELDEAVGIAQGRAAQLSRREANGDQLTGCLLAEVRTMSEFWNLHGDAQGRLALLLRSKANLPFCQLEPQFSFIFL
jgi:hypothetical protein